MAKIGLIALDLDGTVVGENLVVSPRVREAVAKAHARGVTVTIVTGRMFSAALPFAHLLGVSGPIVCYQGAAIYDVASGTPIRQTPLPLDVTHDVLGKAKADRFHAQCYADDTLYVDEVNRFSKRYTDLAQVEPVVVPDLQTAFANRPSLKIVLVDTAARATAYVDEMHAFLGDRAYVTRSHTEFVEVIDPHVNKGEALRFVAQRAGVALENVLAVGDSWNDLPLLTTAGVGIAMGSAPPELKERAHAVVADVAHDGVAEAIERYVLAASPAA
jgi:Cof subfamily protein (haloacid dehalogenase superfamily)